MFRNASFNSVRVFVVHGDFSVASPTILSTSSFRSSRADPLSYGLRHGLHRCQLRRMDPGPRSIVIGAEVTGCSFAKSFSLSAVMMPQSSPQQLHRKRPQKGSTGSGPRPCAYRSEGLRPFPHRIFFSLGVSDVKKVSFSYLTAALTPAATGKYPSKYDSILRILCVLAYFLFIYNFFFFLLQQKWVYTEFLSVPFDNLFHGLSLPKSDTSTRKKKSL